MRKNKIRIVAAGDFCPTPEGIYVALKKTDEPASILGPVPELFQSADISIVNLEYPLTIEKKTIHKYGSKQNGHPDTIRILKESGVTIASIANNHIMDYGWEGLKDTINVCKEFGIGTVGAGANKEEASKELVEKIGDVSIAFISLCENEFSVATENSPGAYGMDLIDNSRKINDAKEKYDIVIVSVHGGSEFTHYPSPEIIRKFRYFVECGASAVIAHHPHYIQGFEIYRGAPILYSLGKLIYTRMSDSGVLEVPVATLEFDVEKSKWSVEYSFWGINREKCKIVELNKKKKLELNNRFLGYCEAIQSPLIIQNKWKEYCKKQEIDYISIFLGIETKGIFFRLLRRFGLLGFVRRKALKVAKKNPDWWLCIRNYCSCESHREAVLTILDQFR